MASATLLDNHLGFLHLLAWVPSMPLVHLRVQQSEISQSEHAAAVFASVVLSQMETRCHLPQGVTVHIELMALVPLVHPGIWSGKFEDSLQHHALVEAALDDEPLQLRVMCHCLPELSGSAQSRPAWRRHDVGHELLSGSKLQILFQR